MISSGCAQNQPQKEQGPAAAPDRPALSGTASCSARGCHGRIEPLSGVDADNAGSLRNEYTLWLLGDPHVRAFSVLSEPRSREIARRLGMVDAGGKPNPFEQERCLACHTNPSVARAAHGSEAFNERSFGVGCESCHGSATRWLGPHTNVDFWRKLTPGEKA